jgi:hypothetical protein
MLARYGFINAYTPRPIHNRGDNIFLKLMEPLPPVALALEVLLLPSSFSSSSPSSSIPFQGYKDANKY